jgi:hypothetical protein
MSEEIGMLDIKTSFNMFGNVTINIKTPFLENIIKIANPNKHGVDMWKYIRNSYNGSNRYDDTKIKSHNYNITAVYTQDNKTSVTVKSIEGILEFHITYEYVDKSSSSIIKLPIEKCFDMLDSIITYLEDINKKND